MLAFCKLPTERAIHGWLNYAQSVAFFGLHGFVGALAFFFVRRRVSRQGFTHTCDTLKSDPSVKGGLMKDWQRRVLGSLALGGGAIGLTAIFGALLTDQPTASKILVLLSLPLYAWGIWCGLQMIERHPGALRSNFWFWAIQIPVLQSSMLSYLFSSGVIVGLWTQFDPVKLNFLAWLGSRFEVSINQPRPLALGVNVVALVVTFFIWRLRRRQPASHSFKADRQASAPSRHQA